MLRSLQGQGEGSLLLSVFISNWHCWVKLQCIKVISLAGITCDSEKEMLIRTMYFKKIFEQLKYFRKVFKYKYF